jgi:hypothetical protein
MAAPKKQKREQIESKDFTNTKKAVLSDIKKKMLKLQEKADRKLEELTYMCQKEESNGK